MYIDFDDKLGINRKFTRMTNPTTAAYFALVLEILKAVRRKKTYDETTGEFKIDRTFIEAELGISKKEQYNADEMLKKLNIIGINKENKDKLAVNVKRYYDLLADETVTAEAVLSKTAKMTREQKKEAKEHAIVNMLLKLFNETDDEVNSKLTTLIWMYYRKGLVTRYQWQPVTDLISKTATTKEEKIALVDHIILTNWQSIGSAIEDYKQKHKGNATRLNTTTKICNKVKDDVAF